MRVAFIVSIPMLGLLRLSDYHLVLPHLFSDSKYLDFYKERKEEGDFVIQDNSVHEVGVTEIVFDLVELWDKIKADELVTPESMFDYEKTRKLTSWFLKFRDLSERPINLLTVVQGQNYEKFKECYEWVSGNPMIKTIGIPYGLPFDAWNEKNDDLKNLGWNRFSVIYRLIREKVWDYQKPHHLFGLYNPAELVMYTRVLKVPNIRGVDSSSVFWCGAHNLRYDEGIGLVRKIKEPIDFNYKYYTFAQYSAYYHNMSVILKFARGEEGNVLEGIFVKKLEERYRVWRV